MLLKFIGEDGSMGLRHGEFYDCTIKSHDGYIWVYWDDDLKACSYGSIEKLAKNWW